METKFEYKTVGIGELQLEIVDLINRSTTPIGSVILHGGKMIKSVIIDGESITPSGRFWESLYSKYGLNRAFFKYFSHLEVFKRIADKSKEKVRICIETDPQGNRRLLAVTGLNKPVVLHDDLMEVLGKFNVQDGIKYSNGIVSSTHTPIRSTGEFVIGGDKFSNRFVMHTPVDGYGQPNIFLSLLRWVCSNGAVGFANSFKTALALGQGSDSIQFTLQRALEAFSNEEGYAMLRERFETSMRSWASIREQQELYKLLLQLQSDNTLRENAQNVKSFDSKDLEHGLGNALLKTFDRITGNPFDLYRISDPNLLGDKKKRTLPVSCKVYDMFNFATELATHHVNENNARQLQAWVGNMLSGEFDLEESCDQFSDWQDMFFSNIQRKQGNDNSI